MSDKTILGYDTDVLRQNFARVRENLTGAAAMSPNGKPPLLIAATKTVPVEVINFAASELRLTDIGENRVQELLEKYDRLDPSLRVHFIGGLQCNKVKYIIDKVAMIHSVDSVRLAEEISRRAVERGIVMDVLAEVNIGRESSKGGVSPEEASEFAARIADLPGIFVRGIMTMAPKCDEKTDYRKYFEETYRIFVDFLRKRRHNIIEPVLSMGMSDSYTAAAEVGATAVRVGSALFGQRTVGQSSPHGNKIIGG